MGRQTFGVFFLSSFSHTTGCWKPEGPCHSHCPIQYGLQTLRYPRSLRLVGWVVYFLVLAIFHVVILAVLHSFFLAVPVYRYPGRLTRLRRRLRAGRGLSPLVLPRVARRVPRGRP